MIATLLAGLLVASGPEVTLWHSYNGAEKAALEAVVRRFHEVDRGFTVSVSSVPYDALADKLTAAIPRGHGPDVFIFAHDRIGGWAEAGLIEPLELLVTEAELDAHETGCVYALAYGESLYGLPMSHKALALYVRTDLAPEPPRDFDALFALAKARTVPARGEYGLVYTNVDMFFHAPLLFSLGGHVFAERDPTKGAPGHVAIDNPGVVRSLALAHRLAKVDGIIPDDPSQVAASAMFTEGRTPMVISGPWFRSELGAKIPYTVVPLPAFPGGVAASGFSTCEGVLLSAKAKHREPAFRFMQYLSGDAESARARMQDGKQPVTLHAAWETVLPTLPPEERAIFHAFREAFQRSVPSPSHPSMAAVWTPMNAALYKTIHRGMDPAAAASEAMARVQKALAQTR